MLLDEVQAALDQLGFGSRILRTEPNQLEFDDCLRLSRQGDGWRIAVIERNLVMDVIVDCAEEQAACAAFLEEITSRHYPVFSSQELPLVEAAQQLLTLAAIPSLCRYTGSPGQTRLMVQGSNLARARQVLKGDGLPLRA
ncbi:MAG: hypothetical protein KDD98_08400 [Sphingomonadaceae bacterium]|nr:hypothetical protein [Sphingomonadaceae bacterium]